MGSLALFLSLVPVGGGFSLLRFCSSEVVHLFPVATGLRCPPLVVSFLLLQYLPSRVLLHCSLAFFLLRSSVVLALGIVVLDSWLGEPVHISLLLPCWVFLCSSACKGACCIQSLLDWSSSPCSAFFGAHLLGFRLSLWLPPSWSGWFMNHSSVDSFGMVFLFLHVYCLYI